ncbi:MAG TPA: HD domain-containing protein [Bacteriovoracaceae bacterium]|nr:HD domain-containing protein [Bacteriovoracaceae bacterium]
MEIRDPIHGSIPIYDSEIKILEHPFFQRLRNIKQLGFSEYVFPGATHTRYLHSIGVMNVATLVFDSLFKDQTSNEILRLKESLRLGCLLHDIGHAPLSHSTESVMPMVSELKLPQRFVSKKGDYQANHEDYTIKSITDSSFTESFRDVKKEFGIDPNAVAELVKGECLDPAYFTVKGINYFPLLHQLVSSEMDCDRMDYLLRDSYFCGVSYGKFDLDWIIDNLKISVENGLAYLGISERAISTFDDFLLSRFHMFMMVYFHYRAVCLEQMLLRYFESANNEYAIPADIEAYLEHDDPHLYKVLKRSQNVWAKRVITNSIPKKILETFGTLHLQQMSDLEQFLRSENIDYIKCSSKGRLSKYYSANSPQDIFPMKVIRESALSKDHVSIKNIQEATDLFQKYSESHAVNRIHCDFDLLPASAQKQILRIIQS